MSLAFFVAGTDTDVGKTTISAGLLHAARVQRMSTAAIKPVASGCELTDAGLRNSDALALQAECSPALDYATVNPFAFAPAIAPHIAAREAGVELSAERLVQVIRPVLARQADFTLVEGAGGWRVPLNAQESLSAVVQALGLPVILVVGVRLGCINHAVLSAEAIARMGWHWPAGWPTSSTRQPRGWRRIWRRWPSCCQRPVSAVCRVWTSQMLRTSPAICRSAPCNCRAVEVPRTSALPAQPASA